MAAAAAFCLVAILNCGGYRYGIGDQAFYVPAVVQHLNPDLFPRDRSMLHAQDRFMLYDDVIAFVSQTTGASVPVLFFAGYLAGMLLLFGAIAAIGRTVYGSWWAVALFAALMTLRHRITQTGANTLEAYFHPRMIAFALGAWAIAAYLRGKGAIALGVIAVAFAIHPTTALWFSIWIAVALAVSDRPWRRPIVAGGGVAAVAAGWAIIAGPLQGHLGRMDPLWASALTGKDYIFPSDWNASFWTVNFAYLAVAAAIYVLRRRRGVARPREAGLLLGAAALVAVFLVAWPLMSAGIALALQLQVSRVFWMLDFVAVIYITWLLAEAPRSDVIRRTAVVVVVAVAVARGVFVWHVEHAGSPVIRIGLPHDNWTDAMRWIAGSPMNTHVLASPGHAWKYGTSVRVSGERDVYLEEVKDLALALYSREVAIRALERIRDVENFDALTAGQLRSLAARYQIDYLVADRALDLPVAYRNDQFTVYALK